MDLEIIKIASNTDNHRVLKNHTHNAKLKNPICGDEMEVSIKIAKDNVIDFGYQCKSCVYCQASASLLSENIVNKKILSIKKLLKIVDSFFDKEDVIFPKDWSIFKKIFNKKNISRKECLLLPFKTLKKALKS
tara:strand:- start:1153 stop:1551 length:399 start_codon:yes stop_codon:yes gene_type:complete